MPRTVCPTSPTILPMQSYVWVPQAYKCSTQLNGAQAKAVVTDVQPCNPAVGGPAKSQLVHEVDAMGGEMGKMADKCYLQKRILNRSKASCSTQQLHV